MTNKLFSKIRPSYVFNMLAIGLLIISVILNMMYENTQKEIAEINHAANMQYVQNLSNNLKSDISRVVKKDIYKSLKDDYIAREYIESNLKLFITTKYKYIYLVVKDNENLICLTKDNFKKDYESEHKNEYLYSYESKKAVYFEHEHAEKLWATYISPIIVEDKVEALLVIKFSLEEQDTISLALKSLGDLFEIIFIFFLLIFVFILWFSYIDKKREEQKNRAFKELQKSNTILNSTTIELKIKSDKISYLNDNLEERVKEEVAKNRSKDVQLIHQARLAQMGEMLSMIAHQWRQPLSAISATSASLNLKARLNKLDNERILKMTDNISGFSQHLSDTIDDFRNFFKPNKDKIETNFDCIIESVEKLIISSLEHKNITLTKELNAHMPFLSFPNELKQVLLNLIRNAEDALVENGVENAYIKISTYKLEGKTILEVLDNGGGINKNIIDKIFDPYFSTKLEKDGTGLGLYMSKMIIEEHCKGRLTVKNRDAGAVFQIILGEDECLI